MKNPQEICILPYASPAPGGGGAYAMELTPESGKSESFLRNR